MRSTAAAAVGAGAAAMQPAVAAATSAGADMPWAEARTSEVSAAVITLAGAATTAATPVAGMLSRLRTMALPAITTAVTTAVDISHLRVTESPIRGRTLPARASSPGPARLPRIQGIQGWVLPRGTTTGTVDMPGPAATGTAVTGRIAGTTRVGPGTC